MTDNPADAQSTSDGTPTNAEPTNAEPTNAEPTNPALVALAESGLDHTVLRHERVDSLEEAAQARGLDPRQVLKTLVVRRANDDYLFVLVPGDRQISWPKMRQHLGLKRISMPDADTAREVTGYARGTITPFGSRTSPAGAPWPVIADAGVTRFSEVSIGGGAPGVSATVGAEALIAHLSAEIVDVTEPAVIHAEPPYWNVTMDAVESAGSLGHAFRLTPGAFYSPDVLEAVKAAVGDDAAAGLERAVVEARRRLKVPTEEQVAQAEAEFGAI